MRISDWSSDVCSSDLSAPADAAATPTQIAQIVEQEFPTYDGDKNGDLNEAEFGAWMKKLRAATDPAADVESAAVTSWIGQARSEERRGGKGGGSTVRSRWAP